MIGPYIHSSLNDAVFTRSGYETRVVMMGESLSRKGGIVAVEKLILGQRIPGVQLRHIATLPNAGLLPKLILFTRAALLMLWRLLRNRVDVIHLHVSQNGSAFRKAILASIAIAFHTPVIMHAHGGAFAPFYSRLPAVIRAWLRWVFQRCSRVVVLSPSWQDFYVKQLGVRSERVVVLPNPVILPRQIPDRNNAAELQILYLGQLDPLKGGFDLIEAFARLPEKQRRRARLILAGDGDVRKARALVSRRGLAGFAKVLDWVAPAERDRLLAESGAFALPSYYEGLPMALLEAMAWELPVITTPVGGIPDLVIDGQNGLLVPPGELDRLMLAIQLLIDCKEMRLRLGANARKGVERFDLACYVRSLARIYHSETAL